MVLKSKLLAVPMLACFLTWAVTPASAADLHPGDTDPFALLDLGSSEQLAEAQILTQPSVETG